jgi:hypothetical protein
LTLNYESTCSDVKIINKVLLKFLKFFINFKIKNIRELETNFDDKYINIFTKTVFDFKKY